MVTTSTGLDPNFQIVYHNPGGFDHGAPIIKRHNIKDYGYEYIIKNSQIVITRILRSPFQYKDIRGVIAFYQPKEDY